MKQDMSFVNWDELADSRDDLVDMIIDMTPEHGTAERELLIAYRDEIERLLVANVRHMESLRKPK